MCAGRKEPACGRSDGEILLSLPAEYADISVQDAFQVLHPPSDMPETVTPEVMEQLKEFIGDYFAAYLSGDQDRALGVLSSTGESSLALHETVGMAR